MRFSRFVLLSVLLVLFVQCANIYQAGDTFYVQGEYDKAIEEYQRLLDNDPLNYDAYIKLGDSFLAMNEFRKAYEQYDYAKQVDSNGPEAVDHYRDGLLKEAKFYEDQGRTKMAIEIYKKVNSEFPELKSIYFEMAKLYESSGLIEKSRESYEKSLESDPENKEAAEALSKFDSMSEEAKKHFDEGEGFYKKGMYYEAADSYKMAVEAKTDFKAAEYKMNICSGRHHLKRGRVMEMWKAIEAFGNAMTLKPDDPEPVYYMAQAYEKKNRKDYETPLPYYQKVITLAPDSEFAKDSKKRIDDLKATKAKMDKFYKKKKKGGDV
ncbi:MAG: tetratricopeptide repeat protein [bacterium]|nr:tetratricopeptide repeat protein [bacterium]